jgi:hypothetical protein
MRFTRALIGVVALVCAACATPSPSPSPSSMDGSAGIGFGARYTCGGPFTFGPELLDRPGGDEDAATPLAAALRDSVGPRNPDEDGALPRDGWILVGQRGAQAQFVAPGDDGVHVVSLEAPNGVWRVMDRGFCSPSLVVPPGIGLAEWDIEPGQQIGPETKSFMALVTEVACASGKSADGRIVGPEVVLADERVLVTFAVRAIPGFQECPGNPATRVRVELPEPLGDRVLRDGSRLPARDPVPVECCGLQSSGARG